MAIRKVGFLAAVEILRNVQVPVRAGEVRNSEETNLTENPAETFTYEKFYQPSEWLTKRGLTPQTLQKYGVGLYLNPLRKSAYAGQILIRIQRFSDGEIVGYLARDPRTAEERAGSLKYQFPPGFQKNLELFGAYQLKDIRPLRLVYVAESPFTVMAFHQKGFPCVSCFGWSISPQQAEIIQQLAKGAVLLPDSNKYKEAQQFAGLLATYLWTKMPPLPDGVTDPESLSLEQIRHWLKPKTT